MACGRTQPAEQMYKQRLEKIEQLTRRSKWARLLAHPRRLLGAVLYKHTIYAFRRKGLRSAATTFFGAPMTVMLPAGTDIYVFGAKTHRSELQLTRYLMQSIRPNQVYFDVGAHVGFYSLLAQHLGANVEAFEPTPATFALLNQNTADAPNIRTWNVAVSDREAVLSFYVHDVAHSENNTTNAAAKSSTAQEVTVQGVRLDAFAERQELRPDFVKIDVEGGEVQVLKGMTELLATAAPTVILEYIPAQKAQYAEGLALLDAQGYQAYRILDGGALDRVTDWATLDSTVDSTNLVFQKSA